ncbi:MAG: sensor histidine kinase [Simplicispira suum]|jgi:two-component system sensor histidine kinase TctE|uniref:sensor histidine kinase n=1 Tax=Simplicispira suum TaxID=2109915 RepID=UPI001C6AD240|nr:sensor histidine kinase [Simplicispira suum]MBW7832023.1 sensor histidine kinase [Simplicispira suum]MCO5104907.1 sensor histidine kinase [Burkholderiaceae bacterium]
MQPVSRVSLKRKLLLWLLLPQLVLWLSGGFFAWRLALQNGEKGIDQTLTQSVRGLARQIKPIGDGLLVDFPKAAQDLLEQDPADRITYMVSSPPGKFLLGNAQLPPPPPVSVRVGEPLLYQARLEGKTVRVALLDVDYGTPQARQTLRVQVAQSLAVRQRIAQELLAKMLLPMGLMGLALSALVYAGVLRGLQPLKRLEAQIEQAGARPHGGADPLLPIELTSAPQEVHSLARTINGLLEAVASGQQKEKRFLNDAAHQLRTPLAGLIAQTELALHESQEPAVRERLEKVLSAARRSAHLVHQLLQLARSEASVEMQPLDLAALAREVARDWAGRALALGTDLGYEGDEQRIVQGQPLLLREALNNLIDNALHYAGPGATVTVHVSAGPNGWAELVVEDDGPGVAQQHFADLFSRFWRGSDQAGGCGLGLSIVEEIALRHGGRAVAEPVRPHGLRAGLKLPLT